MSRSQSVATESNCRLLLREAVKCAQPPDQFPAIDPDNAAIWKKVAQDR
jgi:hypothetical protein